MEARKGTPRILAAHRDFANLEVTFTVDIHVSPRPSLGAKRRSLFDVLVAM
jgi:hypothetical protein